MSFLNISRYLSIALISISVITPAHADDAMSRIRSSGVLHVATEPAYEPFEFMQGNKIVGYGPALLDQILEGTGIKLDRTTTSFSAALPGLLAKKYDMVATSLTITPERARKVAFTRPIAAIELAVLVRADEARIHSMDDLKGKRLGAQVNSNTLSRLAAFDKTLRDQGSQGLASLTQFTDNPELQLALAEKRIDAFLIPVSIARLWVKKQPGTFKVACTDTTSDKAYLAWAVRPDEKDLRDFINLRIKELKASGKLNELQMKWLGAIYETPETDYLPANL